MTQKGVQNPAMAQEGASTNAWTPLLAARPSSSATGMSSNAAVTNDSVAAPSAPQQVSPTPYKTENNQLDKAAWPTQSSKVLPPLTPHLIQGLQKEHESLTFPINEEMTALKFSPTGRVLVGGFTDGTLRVFDLTGRYSNRAKAIAVPQRKKIIVNSKVHQKYGAVAGQIHAKGVHTKCALDVDVAEDGLWCFAGVVRGSMELMAVHLGHLEASFETSAADTTNLLDHLTVYRHSDAKLRGFGACQRLKNRAEYLLFTGKAIKNIHIWSFIPPTRPNAEPMWQQLYDTQTNGTTIRFLQFRESRFGRLQGISKSDGQKLRVWDLTSEATATKSTDNPSDEENAPVRPSKRPPFCDVPNTESTLGVVCGLCLNGGDELFNQLSIVSLDVPDLKKSSPFNHTELALPSTPGDNTGAAADTSTSSSRRRQQRGDLKSITSVAGMVLDARHALLELSDGSVVHYYTPKQSGLPTLSLWQPAQQQSQDAASLRTLSVGRVGATGKTLAAVATYTPATGHGRIVLQALDDMDPDVFNKPEGYWGCLGRVALPYPIAETGDGVSAAPDALSTVRKKTTISAVSTASQPAATRNRVTMVTGTVKKVTATNSKAASCVLQNPASTKSPGPASSVLKKSSSSVVRRLETSTPFAVSSRKRSKIKVGVTESVTSNKQNNIESQPPTKYLKTSTCAGRVATASIAVSVSKKELKPGASLKGNEKKDVVSKTAVTGSTCAKVAPVERRASAEKIRAKSPPVPRKGLEKKQDTVMDAATGLCELSEKPAVTPRLIHKIATSRASKALSSKSPRRSPMPRKKDDPETRKRILAECSKQIGNLRSLLDEIPKESVDNRLKLSCAMTNNIDQIQELARSKLAAEHRARHDLIRKKVLNAALHIIRSVRYAPTFAALDGAKKALVESLRNYQEILDETIHMQQMEAHTLAAQQTCERNGTPAPCLQVSFPFPDVFEQALACTPELF